MEIIIRSMAIANDSSFDKFNFQVDYESAK